MRRKDEESDAGADDPDEARAEPDAGDDTGDGGDRSGRDATSRGDESGETTEDGLERLLAGAPVVLPIEPVIDLHSFLPAEIESVVEEYLGEAVRAGFEEVRIIHGRGIGVQREIVRAVLTRSPFVISFRDAPPGRGGWGATVALLKL